MFIQLYSNKSLQKTKSFCLTLGIFLLLGGSYALIRELLLKEQANTVFAYGAVVILMAGIGAIAFATDRLPVKETYFSMTPERISFRVSFFSKAHTLRWNSIKEVIITQDSILFELKNGSDVTLRLGAIQLPETARHISSSIRLAALERNVEVNGVKAARQRA